MFTCAAFPHKRAAYRSQWNNKSLSSCHTGSSESDRPRFRFLHSAEEAVAAIRGVLSADPRSVYRRTRCRDRLFFFTLDVADITCWFGEGFAEVVQVRPVEQHVASAWGNQPIETTDCGEKKEKTRTKQKVLKTTFRFFNRLLNSDRRC